MDQFMAHVGDQSIADSDTAQTAVAAANRAVHEYCGYPTRYFPHDETTSTRRYRPTDQCTLAVRDFWDLDSLVVETDDADTGQYATTWILDVDFIVEPTNAAEDGEPFTTLVAINRLFPVWNRRPSVRVTAKCGWPAIHEDVISGTLIMANKLWRRDKSPDGIIQAAFDGSPIRVSRYDDPDVVRYIGPLRRADSIALVG